MFRAIQFVGTQRSGSNLLRVMLNQSPEIAAPHPPHILKTFFPLLAGYGDLQQDDNFYQLVADVCEWVNRNPVPWENVTLKTEDIFAACTNRTLIEIFRRIYEKKAAIKGARYWCCKSMESIYYVKELEVSGIRPFYIYLYRDGRDVALSFMKAVVGPKHIYHLAQKWLTEQELSLQLKEQVAEDRFIEVKYEDLISNPEALLKRLCDKLDVAYSESMLQYFKSQESRITAESGNMWKNVVRPILPNNHHKFLKELSLDEIRIFEAVAGKMLVKLGYERITDDRDIAITEDDIRRFNQENEKRMKQVLASADPVELARRKPQEDLLELLKQRVSV
ncbi:MAG: sulfotransferase [Cyclobacteriaceae bacterium]|nr:sulfotransferase [Cyclobacteriaceae bacterium]